MRYRAQIVVSLKEGLLDPQGKAVEGSLPALGWTNVSGVRVGRYVQLDLEAEGVEAAEDQVRRMAERLLSNPVIETFDVVDISERNGSRAGSRGSGSSRSPVRTTTATRSGPWPSWGAKAFPSGTPNAISRVWTR